MHRNTLYYGDNLEVMREHIPDESVDLIYLDPPFNSARDYNVLFKQAKKDENQAQITAFTDTWQWSKRRYDEFFDDPRNARLFLLIDALHKILDGSEMMAYLLMMTPRLLEMHRVLKPTGSLYLHCDPVASHYLKVLLDVIFGPTRFRNEVVWKRTSAHSSARRYGPIHDTIFFYTKSDTFAWSQQFTDYREDYVEKFYRHAEPDTGRRFTLSDLMAAGIRRGSSGQVWRGIDPTARGNHWKFIIETLEELDSIGRIYWPPKGGTPRYKRYLDEMHGIPLQDIFDDISPIGAHAAERVGYPTQKPLALMDRIISASSNEGGVVLDPFCGCGTAVVAAEKLGRKWIGIDITFIAVDLMIARLASDFGLRRDKDYDIKGDPKDAYSARKLFEQSPKQFEIWAVGLAEGVPQPDKSGDKGVDGKVYFQDAEETLQWAVCQVKGGHLTPSMIRDFAHVVEREKAAMGFFICLDKPTKGMYAEAEEAGFFTVGRRRIPKLQIRTIKGLLRQDKLFERPEGYRLKSGSGNRLVREKDQGKLEL
ncbi:MAG: hypothetical protein A2Z18_00030 [Armatimonadetes bacterium RBG_16_58_9]|nr:MAG: hypothetical protein A2Z18_00030 [Armatimonadetes bacterium RBG_16_58_9]